MGDDSIIMTDVLSGESFIIAPDPIGFLHQDDVWTDRAGRRIPLTDISPRYAANIIAFLRKRALGLHHVEVQHTIETMDGPLGPRGDMACMHAEGEFDELCRMDPIEWLDGTKLMIALQKIIVDRRSL